MSTGVVRSARGELVDFDLLRIKEQMASTPKQTTVQQREQFVDQRLKRRVGRLARQRAAAAEQVETLTNDEELIATAPSEEEVPEVVDHDARPRRKAIASPTK